MGIGQWAGFCGQTKVCYKTLTLVLTLTLTIDNEIPV